MKHKKLWGSAFEVEPEKAVIDFTAGRDVIVSQWTRDSWVYISITDCGAGMSEDQINHAVLDFEQIDRDRNEQQGLGLGLYLARRIVEAHQGQLDVVSRPGSGTQITISLPLYEEQQTGR